MNNKDDIKTMKYIKWTKYAVLLYSLFCLISIALITYSVNYNKNMFDWAVITLYLWMTNPMVLVISILGFRTYLREKRDLNKKKIIGKRWIKFVFLNVDAMVLWMLSTVCFVYITGGV